MCGIAGIYSFDKNNFEDLEDQILNMTNSQKHRGPDSYGIYNFCDYKKKLPRLSVFV